MRFKWRQTREVRCRDSQSRQHRITVQTATPHKDGPRVAVILDDEPALILTVTQAAKLRHQLRDHMLASAAQWCAVVTPEARR